MKVLFIGNRLQDLGGFEGNDLQTAIREKIYDIVQKQLTSQDVILTSLSLGIETWAVQAGSEIDSQSDDEFGRARPYHVYIPFKNPHSKWPYKSRETYSYLLKHAQKKIALDDGDYDVSKLIAKDIAMATDADKIYTFFKERPKFLKKFENKDIIDMMPSGVDDDHCIPF